MTTAARRDGAVTRVAPGTEPVGVLVLDRDGRVIKANDAFLAMLGYSRRELDLGEIPWGQLTPAEWESETQSAAEHVGARGGCAVFEKEFFRKDRSRVRVLVAAAPSTNSQQVAFVFDLTARSRAEAALAATEQQLHAVINHLPISLFAFDRSGTIRLAEGRGLIDRGFKPGELIGRSAFELHQHRPGVLQSLRRALAGESVSEVSQLDELAFEVHYSPVFENGQVVGVNGVAINVTDRQRTLDALRDSETRFRTYVDNASDALYVYDGEATIIDVNRRACEMLGYSREQLIGKTPRDIDPVLGNDPEFRQRNARRFETGEDFSFETVHQRSDGTRIPVEVRVRPFRHRGERFVLALVTDITERKRAEEERERTRKLEEERENAVTTERSRLAAEIHDTLAQGLAMIVMQLSDAEAKLGSSWTLAEKPLNMVRELAAESLAYARRTVNMLRPGRPAGGLARAIRDVIDGARRHYAGTIALETTGAPVLLDAPVESALLSIARSAIGNAVRHAQAKRIDVELNFAESGAVRVTIADDGVGFDTNTIPRDGYGLISMQERATRTGIALTLATEPGAGTVVVASWSPNLGGHSPTPPQG